MVLHRPVLIQEANRTLGVQVAERLVRAETERSLSPPPPPDSTFQPEPGELEIYCTDLEWIPPPTPPQEAESTGQENEEDMMIPSTIFKQSYNGDRQSPWGPPTKSMTKKKGWVEPERPLITKTPKPEAKRIADGNELLKVFERRSNGGKITNKPDSYDVGGIVGEKPERSFTLPRKDDDIGGNIHVRVSYTTPSTLHVAVKQASDILTRSRRKNCSPYAIVTLLGDYEVFKTKVQHDTDTPIWNESFDFALPVKFLQSTAVLVVVYGSQETSGERVMGDCVGERATGGTGEPVFLGETHISLATYKHFKVLDDWFPLEDLRREEDMFDGYEEMQKILRGMKNKEPRTLPDTLRQDELRQEEAYSSY